MLNVSTLLTDYHGISDVFLGVPCIVDRQGVREVMQLDVSEQEKVLLQRSSNKLKDLIETIN